MSKLTHLDELGRARMVDVSAKQASARTATAKGILTCVPETLGQVRAGTAPKGSVIRTAELAGIMAAKRTADLIPLCHPLPLTKVEVRIEIDDDLPGVHADPHAERVAAFRGEGLDDPQRGVHGALRVVLVRRRRSEDRHDGIADELLDCAPVTL
jgi:hypothetical protein